MVIKVKPIVKKGNHVTITNHQNGIFDFEWNWDALLKEVQEATKGIGALIATTEAKVKKTRSRKVNKDSK